MPPSPPTAMSFVVERERHIWGVAEQLSDLPNWEEIPSIPYSSIILLPKFMAPNTSLKEIINH